MILLENTYIKAAFVQKGAELKSLIRKDSALDYMWKADPEFWGKTSPVLFPVVGALKDDQYSYMGQVYTLPRHGFAREMDFEITEISSTEVLFTLIDTPETRLNYPFSFNLGIRYKLEGTSLICQYEVYNPDTKPLLFSIGGHPAFAVPLKPQEEYTDYYLAFNADVELEAHKIAGKQIADERLLLPLNGGKLMLTHELFYDDALVVKNLKSNQIYLRNMKNNHSLTFLFEGFPYFGIWAAKDADFVCLEPWCGLADHISHQGRLEEKEGIVELGPQMHWERKWEIAVI